MPKEILFNEEARSAIKKGLDKLADAVKVSLGPRGRNVIIDQAVGPFVTNDGITIARHIDFEDQFENVGARLLRQAASKTNDVAGDGPQPLYSKVLTPNGFVKMGDLNVGDDICGTNGTIQKVLGVFLKGKKEIYKVRISGGREVECCEDHLWKVFIQSGGMERIMTTRELLNNGLFYLRGEDKSYKYYTPRTAVEFNKKKLPLDPYLVGVLIGDGSLGGLDSTEISLGINKEHIINKIFLPEGISMNVSFVKERNYFRVKIVGSTKEGRTIRDFLNEIGLLGSHSNTKYIPKDYLYSDLNSRQELLQGLADTDGYINDRGLLEYSTVSNQLHLDVVELLRGLGKDVYSYLMVRTDGSSYSDTPIYRIYELSGRKLGNKIIEIVPTGEFTEMQCIKVSNPDNLYITNDYVVTHNTTTATVIAQALIREGFKNLAAGANPLAIRRGLDLGVTSIVSQLKLMAQKVEKKEDIESVASVSANNAEMGKIIADTINAVGKDGAITVEESQGITMEKEIVEGMKFDKGWVSPHFINNPDRGEAIIEDAAVLITDYKLSVIHDLLPFLEKMLQAGKREMLVIADEIDGEVLATFAVNYMQKKFLALAVKAPGFGNNKKEILEDLAILTGGTVISQETGMKFADAGLEVLGFAKRIVATRDNTIIAGGGGDKTKIKERIVQIKNQAEKTDSKFEKTQLEERSAKLSGGVAVIKVGAPTEVEIKEKKYKVEDALNATKAAVEEGIVVGGGVALIRAAQEAELPDVDSPEEMVGVKILWRAVESPLDQIAENAGVSGDVVVNEVKSGEGNYGYNGLTRTYSKDLVKDGIIDPVKVTRSALQNAVSIAIMFLTSEAVICEAPEKKGGQSVPALD